MEIQRKFAFDGWTMTKRACIVVLALTAMLGCRSRISPAEQDATQRAEFGRRAAGERQIKPIGEIARDLGCGGRRAVVVQFDSGEVIPERPNPGGEINHRLVYSACPPATPDQLTGTLTRRITYGRATIMEDKEKVILKAGRWSMDVFIAIPPKVEPGWYRMEAVFENGTAYARDRRDFQVIRAPAR